MSKHSEKFEILKDQETVKKACRYAFKEMQVAVQNESENSFIANEKQGLLAYANPAKIEVSISSSGEIHLWMLTHQILDLDQYKVNIVDQLQIHLLMR